MTVIATAAIKITAETGDLNKNLADGSKQVRAFAGAHGEAIRGADGHTLAIGRIERALGAYVGHALGANAVTESLATAFGGFAIGSVAVSGVLLGITAIVGIYETLTSKTRGAKKEQDDLIASFEKAQRVKGFATGAGGQVVEALNARISDASERISRLTASNSSDLITPDADVVGAVAGKLSNDQKRELDQANADLKAAAAERDSILQKGAEDTDRTYAGNLASLTSSNRATAAERQRALNLIKAYQAELKQLSPTDTAGRDRISGLISTLQAPFDKEAADAIRRQAEATRAQKEALGQLAEQARANLGIFDELKSHAISSAPVNTALIAQYNRISEEIRNMGGAATPARAELMQLRDALAANLAVAQAINREASTGTVGPLVGKILPVVGTTANGALGDAQQGLNHTPNVGGVPETAHVETAIERQTREDKANADLLKSAIGQSAATIASVVGNAILRVGSGPGSQLGGAIGAAAGSGIGAYLGGKAGQALGGVAGAAIGSVIPVVGTIIGGFLGSAIGGLFGSHKKAIDQNTAAVNANTQALLLNAPSGFKVDSYRFNASDAIPYRGRGPSTGSPGRVAGSGGDIVFAGDVHFHGVQDLDSLGRQVRSRATRGGANPLVAAA